MTRTEKITKLANAIREYRGITSTAADTKAEDVIWRRAPHPKAMARIEVWLARLRLDRAASVKAIDGFKSFGEFRAWLRGIQ